MFWSSKIRVRYELLGNNEVAIKRQSRNPILLIIILFFNILNVIFWLISFTVVKKAFATDEWFIYDFSMRENFLYFLTNQCNYHADQLMIHLSKRNSFKEILTREREMLKAGGRQKKFTSDWMYIEKASIYGRGRHDVIKPLFEKILNAQALKSVQKGRRFGASMELDDDPRPSMNTTVYPMTDGDRSMNIAFQATAEEMGADTVMPYRDEKKEAKDFTGKNARKKRSDLNENDEGHKRRMKYMNSLQSQGQTFNPDNWDFETGQPR